MKKKVIPFFLALLSAVGITCSMSFEAYYISGAGMEHYSALSRFLTRMSRCLEGDFLLTSLLAIVVYLLLLKVRRLDCSLRDRISAVFLAVCFSTVQLFGKAYTDCNDAGMLFATSFLLIRSLLCLLGMSILMYGLILLAFQGMDHFVSASAEEKQGKIERKQFWLVVLFIFICWLPYLIYYFPGVSSTDTATQIAQFFGQNTWTRAKSAIRGKDIVLSNHFPYFTTVLYGTFIKIGLFFGNASIGVFLHSVLQMIFMAGTFAALWFYLRYIGLPGKIVKAGILFTAVFPLYPVYAICMLKDPVFAMLTLILSMFLCEIVRTKAEILNQRRFCAGLFCSALLFMLFRNQGVYILILAAVLFLIVFRRKWRGIICTLVIPVLLFQFVWMRMLYPVWNVAPGGRQELLGVLFQQTARYVRDYPDEVTEEEAEAIAAVIDYEKLAELYVPTLSDNVKFTFDQDCTEEELSNYYKAWFSMFLKHPDCYIQAVLNNCYGFFYMPREGALYYHSYFNKEYWEGTELEVKNLFYSESWLQLSKSVHNIWRDIPVAGLLFCPALYFWLVIFYYVNTIRRKDYWGILTGFVLLVSSGVLILSPANGNVRYMLPLIFSAPLILGLCLIRPFHENRNLPE